MHFLQVCSHYVPAYHFGGALHVAHSLGRELVAQGHTVHVCTTNLKDPWDDLQVKIGTAVNVDGVCVYYERVRLSRYWGFSPSMVRRLWSEIEAADAILIHFHYQFASLIAGWICRMRRKPYVVFSHGSLNRYGVSGRSPWRKRLYLRLLEWGNLYCAQFVAYHSEEEMESSIRVGRSCVVPNGIDPRSFGVMPRRGFFRGQHAELLEKTVFLYLGRLDAGKGLELLLPAFKRLAAVCPNVHLVLAGGDERGYRSTVEQWIASLGLHLSVTLTGLISGETKLGVFQDADCYVLPSRSEGLSIAMLEAMYVGLPVIVTDRVGLWRTIQEQPCGWVVPFNEDRLFEAMLQAARSSERVELGERGRSLIRSQFTWDTIARNLIARIQEYLN